MACLIPLAFTLFIIYTQANAINKVPGEFVIDNLVGPWSSLLLGILVIILSYIVTEEEQQKNMLNLYRSYKSNWYGWIVKKSFVVIWILLCIFLINLMLNAIIIQIVEGMIADSKGFASLYSLFLTNFSKAYIFVLPCLFFQLLLSVLIKKPVLPIMLGLFIMILGVPIANLSDTYLIPYSYPILSQKPSINILGLSLAGILIIISCIIAINR